MKNFFRMILFVIISLIELTLFAGNPDLFYYVSDGSNELYSINRTNGVTTLIGSPGVNNIEAIAFYPIPGANQLFAANGGDFGVLNTTTGLYTSIGEIDGGATADGSAGAQSLNDVDGLMLDGQTFIMWAIERNGGATPDLLFQIDVTTGLYVSDAFGSGVDYLEITGSGVDVDADDLAVDPTTGLIYASSNNSGNDDVLLEINKYTGVFSFIANLSEDDVEGLAFSNDGQLYGAEGDGDNRLSEINLITGVMSNFNGFSGSDVESLAALVADANEVSGTVYEDLNYDGIKDGGELGIANVRIYLYQDVNGDGQVDPEDTRLQSTLTDINGDYSFYYAATGSLLTSTKYSSFPANYGLTTDNVETISFTDAVNFAESDADNNFGLATGPDCDGDGIPNFFEGGADSDLDAVPDSCDLDSDNDGILDNIEGTEDFDDDGIPDYIDRDSDDDGIPDAIEANAGILPAGYNSLNGNIDGAVGVNGIVDAIETAPESGVMIATNPDSDNDGLRDYRDLDSDNDGILDIIEAGGIDTDGDGQQDVESDFNQNGYADILESNSLVIPNTDNVFETLNGLTLKPDYIDIDSDADGIDDTREGLSTTNYRFPTLLLDSDEDGIIDFWDVSTFSTPITPYDRDGDGTPDFQDNDSDNDGVSDLIEGNDANNDGVADDAFSNTDADDNGLDDAFDASCTGASLICSSDVAHQDFDGDGEDDFRDTDDDNDGIPTLSEIPDSEPNGTPDYLEDNSSGCGPGLAPSSAPTAGNADAATNVNNVPTAGNATGVADGSFAQIHTNGDMILLDLTDIIPTGSTYTITWRERASESGTASMILEESIDGVNFTTHPSAPTTNSTTFVGAVVTANSPARYLRISKQNTPSVTDFEIDAVSYNTEICDTDSDSDGILDEDDIDDDNDGILDTDEDASCRGNLDFEFYDGTPSGNTVDNIPNSGALATGVVTDFDVDVLQNSSDPGDSDTYGIRYSGFITISTSETYTFYTTSDDGSKLYVDGIEVVDNDGLQAATEGSGTIVLTPGTYSFVVEYFENSGDDILSVSYSSASISKRLIPFSVLSTSSSECDTDNDGVVNRLDLDSDNDGIADIIEAGGVDDDNNGRVDSYTDGDSDGWANTFDSDNAGMALSDPDSDGDGLQDRIDIDADNDGIVDNIEAQLSSGSPRSPSGVDTDGDGVDDSFDSDLGNNLLIPINTDGTDNPDYTDTDSDNDGDLDLLEGWDTDNDGIADTGPSGLDSDNDGLDNAFDDLDGLNSSTNVTNDGQTSESFPDLDNSITIERDWREFNDADGDGISDNEDVDDDNDGIKDIDENIGCSSNTQSLAYEFYDVSPSGSSVHNIPTTGADGTGSVTEFDVDALFALVTPGDGNNFSIRYSGFITISTEDTYTFYTSSDDGSNLSIDGVEIVDNDGPHGVQEQFGTVFLPVGVYAIEVLFFENTGGEFLSVSYANSSFTKTALPFTILSEAGICDSDGDGIINQLDLDSDNDGIADIIEAGGVDTNGDGRVDGVFNDGNNADGWSNVFDDQDGSGGTPLDDEDQDGDGLKNRIDLDADDDGIADIIEAGGVDVNGDGQSDSNTDDNNNGFMDSYDITEAGESLVIVDTDGDGISNYLDLDSDSDGITDNIEGRLTSNTDTPSGTDFDNDGWDDIYDGDVTGAANGTPIVLSNNEGSGNPDYTDDDSDGDGFPDWIEGFDDDEDGDALNDMLSRGAAFEASNTNPGFYSTTDLNGTDDGDDIPDWLEDDDSDGTPNFLDPDNSFYQDNDGDGIIDLYDSDENGVASITPDTDGDGEYDFRDGDDEVSLPIVLLYFEASKAGKIVQLDWVTSSEINNDYFIIQKLNENKLFVDLEKVDGAGNSNQELTYRIYDNYPTIGNNYYRLKQVDYDGTSTYSKTVIVNFYSNEFNKNIGLFPNPTNGEKLFLSSKRNMNIYVRIISIDGKVLKEKTYISSDAKIEILEGLYLSKGFYFLEFQLNKNEKTERIKFVIK